MCLFIFTCNTAIGKCKKFTETSTVTTLMSLAWNVDKLSRLDQQGRKLVIEVSVMKN